MNEIELLTSLPEPEQVAVLKRLTLFLRSREIEAVIERVGEGDTVLEAHRSLGLLEKYRGDLRKILFGLG
ncbi:hypothetical protein [Salinispira pacifica]